MKRRNTKSEPFWADGRPISRKDKLLLRREADRVTKAITEPLSAPPKDAEFVYLGPVRFKGGLNAFLKELAK